MSDIYYAFIVLPIIILTVLIFAFQSSVEAIAVQQTILNCPYPVNSGVATLSVVQSNFPPVVNYTVVNDASNSTDYHVTLFNCGADIVTGNPTVSTDVYTATSNWFDVTQGFLFYLSESIQAFFDKVIAVGNLLYLILFAPAQVTGLAWFAYVEVVLFSFIAIGAFMVVRGG